MEAPYSLPHSGVLPKSPCGICNIARQNICFYLRWKGHNDGMASVILWSEVDLEPLHRIKDGTGLRRMKIGLQSAASEWNIPHGLGCV
jgi:hypothetical protein